MRLLRRFRSTLESTSRLSGRDNGAYDQVLGTTLMDFDNMPMILTCGGAMNGTIVSAAEEGAFWICPSILMIARSSRICLRLARKP